MTLLEQYEWVRHRLGVQTPKDAGIEGAKKGDEPEWQKEPSNYKLRSFIQSACNIVNRHVGLADAGSIRSLAVSGTTATGPLPINLGAIPGFRDRSIIAIRRLWWNDGTTSTRLSPFILDQADLARDPYIMDQPGTPRRFAIEGYSLWLDPPPTSNGTLQFMASCGVLMPVDDMDSFDQIPEAYDECVLYIAIVEYGKSVPRDAEMYSRAQSFAPDAAAGLDRLASWFGGESNPEAQVTVPFDARFMRRYRRR